MLSRHDAIESFSGALVFPGGKVGGADRAPALSSLCRGAAGLDGEALAFRVAAIREAFEECGVLLAYADGNTELVGAERLRLIEETWRRPLVSDQASLSDICLAEGLELAVDSLVHFAYWVTPRVVPRIFDTHFYLAAAPLDQVALHDGEESTDSAWLEPDRAIAEADAGRLNIVFPTRMNLLKLGRSTSVDEALARTREAAVVTVQPELEPHAKGRLMHIPASADYGASTFIVGPDGRGLEVVA